MSNPLFNGPSHSTDTTAGSLHPLLSSQLESHNNPGKSLNGELSSFLKTVSQTYELYEEKLREARLGHSERSGSENGEKEELKRVYNELRTLFENIEEVFFSIDMRNQKFTQMSAGCEKILGFKAERFFVDRKLWEAIVHPGDRELAELSVPENVNGRLRISRYRIIHADGGERWIKVKITPTFEEGTVVRIDGLIQDITEKVEDRIKIRESERRYWLVSTNPILGISWASEDGRMVNVNEAFCKMLDYTADEIYRKHFSEFSHPDDVSREIPLLDQMLHGELNNYQIEKRYITRSGSIIWVELNLSCVRDEAGKVEYFIGIIQDITSKKVAEDLHRKSEANLRNILENTEMAYVLLDLEANILSFNQVANALALAESGEPLAERKNYISLMAPERRAEVEKIIGLVLRHVRTMNYNTKYTRTDGTDIWLHVSVHPIVEEDKVLGLSIAANNITKSLDAEEAIRLSNERYSYATRATNDVIWDWDLVNDRIYRSENYEQVFGFQPEGDHSLVDSWVVRIHEDDKMRVMDEVMRKVNETDASVWEAKYRYYRTNGELAYVQDRGFIIHDENNKPMRMVGAMRDITSEKIHEIERERITSDLIQRNKDLEQFAYIISHNLRAPVANIMGLSDMLQNGLEESERIEVIRILTTSVHGLDQVIKDLNTILQVKREVSEVREKIIFSQLIEEVQLDLAKIIRKEQAVITTDFGNANEFLSLRSYLHSIFFNLIANSIKYKQPDRKPVISISSLLADEKVRIVFSDNGMGIDLTANSEKVFGLYKRFHPNIEGRGMGLFMVKTQVETLGGSISIDSEVNKGTTFTIEFPI